jgi:hypothetical protein
MSYEQKDNSGSLFKNSRKEKDTHPDYSGSVKIDGVEYWQSAWLNKDKNGNTYLKQEYKRKDNQLANLRDELNAKSPQAPGRKPSPADDLDDSIPF